MSENLMAINVTCEPESTCRGAQAVSCFPVSLYNLLRSAATCIISPKIYKEKGEHPWDSYILFPAAWPRKGRDRTQEDTVIIYTLSFILHHKIPFSSKACFIEQETNQSPHAACKVDGPFLLKKSSFHIISNQLNVKVQSSLWIY